MGRMKLTAEEYCVLRDAIRGVLDADERMRRKENKSWFVRPDGDGNFKDNRRDAEELYEYVRGIPERSKSAKISKMRVSESAKEVARELLEGKMPPQMSMKMDDDTWYILETTLCGFVSCLRFERDEANKTAKKLLDRVLLHHRRSYGAQKAYWTRRGFEVSNDNPVPDKRDQKYHRPPDEPSFVSLDKVGEKEGGREIPPRLSDQQKFILAKLLETTRKDLLSRAVAYEFEGDGNRWDSWKLSKSHSASFSRALSRLEERGLVVVTLHVSPPSASLTDKGREVAREIKRRAEDGRYNLEFKTL